MRRSITYAFLLSLMSSGAFAMTDNSSHYSNGSPQAQIDDPDEKDNFQSSPSDGAYGQNQREQQLLGGYNNGQQTYGFGSPDGSLSYGIGPSAGYGFRNNGY